MIPKMIKESKCINIGNKVTCNIQEYSHVHE